MGQQLFEVGDALLGSRTIPNFRDFPDLGKSPERSYCYFCGRCGGIWGRLTHEGADWTTIIHRPCERHGDGRLSLEFPAGQPLGLARDWPREALLRELLLECKIAERGL